MLSAQSGQYEASFAQGRSLHRKEAKHTKKCIRGGRIIPYYNTGVMELRPSQALFEELLGAWEKGQFIFYSKCARDNTTRGVKKVFIKVQPLRVFRISFREVSHPQILPNASLPRFVASFSGFLDTYRRFTGVGTGLAHVVFPGIKPAPFP
jgi:hypothetical protein